MPGLSHQEREGQGEDPLCLARTQSGWSHVTSVPSPSGQEQSPMVKPTSERCWKVVLLLGARAAGSRASVGTAGSLCHGWESGYCLRSSWATSKARLPPVATFHADLRT